MWTPYARPSFSALPQHLRTFVVRGFRDVASGAVTPKWCDTRAELLEAVHAMLNDVLSGEPDDDECEAACWAIGRDLATARQRPFYWTPQA
jgi:hypothetical protein